jgi:hydroxyethylthiazole kinase-like uncharacterized protein yjeF
LLDCLLKGRIVIKIVTCQQMKDAEAYAINSGITSARLMENAGSASARFIRGAVSIPSMRCTVICGCGNNGGDGFVVARRLMETGAPITVILACGIPQTREATEMYERLGILNATILDYGRDRRRCVSQISQSSVIVDAIFGTGFHGAADDTVTELFEKINHSDATVFSLDMPSGANADTGAVERSCINAAHTIAFAASKTGQFSYPAASFCGKITVVNIGISDEAFAGASPVELLGQDMVKALLPVRAKDSNKGNFGKLLCLCGSLTMPGAAYMSSLAAARCGAGLITLGAPKSIYTPLASKLNEVMITPLDETPEGSLSVSNLHRLVKMCNAADAAVIGCGISRSDETEKLVCALLPQLHCTVVLDADGINAISGHINLLRASSANLILTPHPGEMARLTGLTVAEIQADRINTARDFATQNNVTLVLKGAETVVASPDGYLFINPTGNPGMARGGSGDILAGMIAGFAVQGIEPTDAACCGVYIHGLAGDRCAEGLSQYGMLPTDMLLEIPQIFRDMSR